MSRARPTVGCGVSWSVLGLSICWCAVIAGAVFASGENTITSQLEWDADIGTVFAPRSGGAWYPRLLRLRDGGILCSYDTDDGAAHTYVQISRSEDAGQSWRVAGRVSTGVGNAANGQLLERADGSILCAYRLVLGEEKSIELSRSGDGGRSWVHVSTVVADRRGVWEPHLLEGQDGEVLMFYATEARPPQSIVMRRSRDGGRSWSEEDVVAAHSRSRDGMPVAARLADGAILVVFEAQDVPGHPFVVRSVLSRDGGGTWGERRLVHRPSGLLRRASAPYVVVLGEGTWVVSFQSDDGRRGLGDEACDMRVIVSRDQGEHWGSVSRPFELEEGSANWNSLLVLDERTVLAAASLRSEGKPAIRLRRGRTAETRAKASGP